MTGGGYTIKGLRYGHYSTTPRTCNIRTAFIRIWRALPCLVRVGKVALMNHTTRSGWNTRGGTDAEHQRIAQDEAQYQEWLSNPNRNSPEEKAKLTQAQQDNLTRIENYLIRQREITLRMAEDDYSTLVYDYLAGVPEATYELVNQARINADVAGEKLRETLRKYGRIPAEVEYTPLGI